MYNMVLYRYNIARSRKMGINYRSLIINFHLLIPKYEIYV